MKKNFFATLCTLAIVAIISVLTSCSEGSSYLGLDEELLDNGKKEEPIAPDPDATTSLESVVLDAKFMTQIFELNSYDYFVSADYVQYLGSTELSRKNITQSLELNVLFGQINDTYVATEAELENVTMTGSNKGEVSDSIVNARFGKVITSSYNHSFKFDQNEVASAKAKAQRLEYNDTIFPHASIRNISFKEAKSVKNEALCNEDSLVHDVTLYFNVDIVLDREVKSRAVDANVETYVVEVPYRRIYKTGYVAPTDEYVKTIVLNYTDELLNGNREMSVTTAEVWSVSGQKNEKTEKFSVPYLVKSPSAQTIYSANASYQTTGNGMSNMSEQNSVNGNWSVTTRTQNYSSSATNGLNPFNNVYSVSDSKVVYSYKEAKVEFPYGNWTISEGNSSISGPSSSNSYDVYAYVNNIDYIYAITSDSKRGSAKAQATIYVKQQPKDEYVKTIIVSSSDKIEGNDRVISVTTAEVWSVSGQKTSETETIRLPFTWSNPSVQDIYTSNVNYSTRSNGQQSGKETSRTEGNFKVTTMKRTYSSTASNNDKNFNNVYSMSDSKVSYSKKEVSLDFGYGTWNVVEGQSTVGSANVSGNYNVYPYTNSVSYTYSLNSGSKSGNGEAKANLYVEKPAEKIIPDTWGKIIGAGISAVPSDDLGESVNIAKKCLTIRTEKGAVAVVFDWNNNICSVNNILNGYFVEGNFDASYNSGYYTTSVNRGSYEQGKWAPAKAKDIENRIAYYSGSKCVRNVSFTTLKMWNWANGNSTVVSGYTFNVSDNGTLTVSYNGQTLLSIR